MSQKESKIEACRRVIEKRLGEMNAQLPQKVIDEFSSYIAVMDIPRKQFNQILEEVCRRYQESTVDPYEAVGIVAAQSVGEPGTQMCVDGDERLIIKHGGNVRIVAIGEFTDALMERCGIEKSGPYEIARADDEIHVLALNEEEKLEWKRVISFNRHVSPENLIAVKTASGRRIVATDFHSFVTRKENKIFPIAGKELKIGDRIPSIRYMPENCMDLIETKSLMPGDLISDLIESGSFISTRSSQPLPNVLKLDENLGYFIGAYLSEGSLSNREVAISNIDEDFLSGIRNFARSLNLGFKEFKHHRGFAWSNDLKIRSTMLHKMMENICGKEPSSKHVPDIAYSANHEFVSGLLRGYFDGDGNISIQRKMIRISSNSEELVDGIKLLLTRFGIFAHKIKEKQAGLLIPFKYAPLFLEKIGSNIPEKRHALTELANLSKKFLSERSQDCTDMISGFDDVLYRTAKKLGYPTRMVSSITKRQRIGRTKLHHYIVLFKKLSKEKGVDISDELRVMERMYNSDVVWDEIVSIESVLPTGKHVYDLSVEGAHTFATFDGIITHNTMRTFHYAGVAEMNVTLGLPRLIEIVDARSHPSTPMMTIHLKPEHKDDPLAAQRIANRIESTRLVDIADISCDVNKFRITVNPDMDMVARKGIKIEDILERLSRIRNVVAVQENNKFICTLKEVSYRNLLSAVESVKNLKIKGVDGISRVIIRKEEKEYVIYTQGSNLTDIMEIEGIDPSTVYTNDILEIASVFGIEAARNAIIRELRNTLAEQGLNVDIRHIMLIADVMTVDGEVKAIGRTGVSSEKASVLARAAFEITVHHLLEAGLKREVDPLKGIAENIIAGQVTRVGTGLVRLKAKE